MLSLIASAPDYLTCYGWSVRPFTLHSWLQELARVEISVPAPLQDQGGDVHVFTDGSCLNQGFPSCRLAAWAVVLADARGVTPGQVLDAAPLPGMMQSSYRAEIFAVLRALNCMRLQSARVAIWTDCNAVVKRFGRLLLGGDLSPTVHMLIYGWLFMSVFVISSLDRSVLLKLLLIRKCNIR